MQQLFAMMAQYGRTILNEAVKAALIDAMKERVRDLEKLILISPDDMEIVYQKRILREKIAELEREDNSAA